MITKLYIDNYKQFQDFKLDLRSDLNILVGDNEAGKSSILEAIGLALTKRLNGRLIESELGSHLFNQTEVLKFVEALKAGKKPVPPRILIEIFLNDADHTAKYRGSHNSEKTDASGVRLEISLNQDFAPEYEALLESEAKISTVPTEYYVCKWHDFKGAPISPRGMPIKVSYIDASTIRLQSGTDFYLRNIINNNLDPKDKAALSVTYRKLKETFSGEDAIKSINDNLSERKGGITDKELAISIDVSQQSNWETNLIPYLDDLPFHVSGMGEQSALKIMLALERQADETHIVLIEEPENHLSFASMQMLISKISEKCAGKQIVITTHSAYVLNKLGMDKTILLHDGGNADLSSLDSSTYKYFKKLSGYDTLRIILAKRSILVEGPSDELIVHKAYQLKHGGRLPLDDGIDVINVRGLSFPRFLDIAKELKKHVCVITDNDGNYEHNIVERYSEFRGEKTISIFSDADNNAHTLEAVLVRDNDLANLNQILGKEFKDKEAAKKHMCANKTECALKIFESDEAITLPDYINSAL